MNPEDEDGFDEFIDEDPLINTMTPRMSGKSSAIISTTFQDQLRRYMKIDSPVMNMMRTDTFMNPNHRSNAADQAMRDRAERGRDAWHRTIAALNAHDMLDKLYRQRDSDDYIVDNGQKYMVMPLDDMVRLMDVLEVAAKHGVPEAVREPLTPAELNHLLTDVNTGMKGGWGRSMPNEYRGMAPGDMPHTVLEALMMALSRLGLLA